MAAKIKDGLFIGDAETSQDPEFLELNKISNLINFSGREIPNVWAAHGLVYNTYNWEDRDDFKLFDSKNEILTEIVTFVDKAIRHGASVLLFSTKGIGRCTAAVCAYLMYKYGWGFEKSYDFVYSKKPDVELNRGFVEQLFTLDKRLRHKRYQGREGNDLSSNEHKRIHEWDPAYLVQSAAEEENNSAFEGKNLSLKKSLAASHIIPDTTSMDELLMVHSYINSKMTITSLPGPYQDALRQPKSFTLQINLANNQEAGVHLRRTVPPPKTLTPRGGILKGGPNNYRVMSQRAAQPQSHSKNKVSQHKHTMRDLEEDSSSLSDQENGTRPQSAPPNRQNTTISQQPSIETLSLQAPSQSSQASDLYDFVGLSQHQNDSKRNATPEERLHNLLGELQRGDRSKTVSSTAEPKGVRSSHDRDMKHLSSKQTSMSTLTPSSSAASIPSTIHDIASMTIQPSYQPPSATTTRTRTYGHQTTTPSSSQPVKTSSNISIQKDRGESKQKYEAWIDRDGEDGTTASSSYYNHSGKAKTRGPGGTSSRPVSAPSASTNKKPPSNGTPSQTYRHGSPAPQISRTGLAAKSQTLSSTQRDRDDGSIDERDNRSTASASSTGSRIRASTPTRQSSNDSSGRSNTPLRQRAPSPSMREKERGTPTTTSIGPSPRDREEPNRRLSGGSRETSTSGRSSTPLRERPESRERGATNGTTSIRSGTPSRGVRTDGTTTTGRSSSPWSSTEKESSAGYRGWKY